MFRHPVDDDVLVVLATGATSAFGVHLLWNAAPADVAMPWWPFELLAIAGVWGVWLGGVALFHRLGRRADPDLPAGAPARAARGGASRPGPEPPRRTTPAPVENAAPGRVVYYDPARAILKQPPCFWGRGSACAVDATAFEPAPGPPAIEIGVELHEALWAFGVVEALEALPHAEGPFEDGEEVVLLPEALPRAAGELRRIAGALPEPRLEIRCGLGGDVEYRLRADREALRAGLLDLAGLCDSAAQRGLALELAL